MAELQALTHIENKQQEPPAYREVGTKLLHSYYTIEVRLDWFSLPPMVSEVSDRELPHLIYNSGAFEFLESLDEDIYTLNDGEPV